LLPSAADADVRQSARRDLNVARRPSTPADDVATVFSGALRARTA
jgi:hypothetical protein